MTANSFTGIVNTEGEYVVLSGNQVGSLLVNYVLSNKSEELKNMKSCHHTKW